MLRVLVFILIGCIGIRLDTKPNNGCWNSTGNSCFMNASIQALFHLKSFRDFLGMIQFYDYYNQNSKIMRLVQYINTLQDAEGPLSEKVFRDNFCPNIMKTEQHDAQEFISYLFDQFIEECSLCQRINSLKIVTPISKIDLFLNHFWGDFVKNVHRTYMVSLINEMQKDNKVGIQTSLNAIQDHFNSVFDLKGEKKYSFQHDDLSVIVKKIIDHKLLLSDYAYFRQALINLCMFYEESIIKHRDDKQKDCVHHGITQPNYILSLPLPRGEEIISLENVIKKYYGMEILVKDERLKCGDKKFDAQKELKILSLPRILVIQLKRFSFDWETNESSKNAIPVSFLFDLDLTSYLSEKSNQKKAKYKLRSFIVQSGILDGGHYWAYAYDRDLNKWYRYEDAIKPEVVDAQVKNIVETGLDFEATPYLLFYERVDQDEVKASNETLKKEEALMISDNNNVQQELKKLRNQLQDIQDNLKKLTKKLGDLQRAISNK